MTGRQGRKSGTMRGQRAAAAPQRGVDLPPDQSAGTSVGRRLREIRAARRLSVRALAELSGLNVNTVSLIENERTSPSVSTLQQVAQGLRVPISEFFQADEGSTKLVHQKNGSRPRMVFENTAMEDLAAGMPRLGPEPIILSLDARATSGEGMIVHTGREFVYCLEGRLAYTVEDRVYLLEAGDSLCFEAYLPHRWRNPANRMARALLVLCPMDLRDAPRERHFAS